MKKTKIFLLLMLSASAVSFVLAFTFGARRAGIKTALAGKDGD